MRTAVNYLVYLVVRLFICLVQAMPLQTCRSVAGLLALLATDVLRLRRNVVDENLAIAFPQLSARQRRKLTRGMWEHLFLMVMEIAHLPRKVHRSNWRKYFHVPRLDRIVEWLLDGRPKVIVSGHFGNFELSGYVLGLFGFPTFTVARPLDNPFLHDFVNRFRGSTGQWMLSKHGSSADIDRQLAAGGILGVLGDQACGPKGCWIDFFNRPASTHKAIAVFALANEATLAVGYATRQSQPLHYEIGISATADPRTLPPNQAQVEPLTQWHARELEHLIRNAPEQYWWVHRRWKGEPPPRRKRNAA